ncbi:MAG: O-antigen ligase family protein [Saprospiraceae bacterium]|nr:O-antigen ligase family protein [Saprospiraceae bacterium]
MADKILLALTFAVMGIGYLPSVIDGYLVGRFLFISILGFGAYVMMLRRAGTIKLNFLDLFVSLYIFYNYISLSWTALPSAGLPALQTTFLFGFFYFYFRSMGEGLYSKQVFWMINGMSLLAIGFALYHTAVAGYTFGLDGDNIYKVATMNGHKNLFSSFAFLLIGVQTYGMFRHKSTWWQLTLVAVLFILIVILRSRAALLAVFIFGLILIFALVQGKMKHIERKRFWQILIGSSALFAAALLLLMSTSTTQDLNKLLPTNFLSTLSGQERSFVWYKTIQQLSDNWLLGSGIGNWKINFPALNIEGAYRLQTMDAVFTRTHNDFLEVFSELGIFGILSFIGIFVLAIVRLLKKKSDENKFQRFSLLGLFVGYMIISFFDFPKERVEHNLLLAFILALSTEFNKYDLPLELQTFLNKKTVKNIGFLAMFMGLSFNILFAKQWISSSQKMIKIVDYQRQNNWAMVSANARNAYHPWYQLDHTATAVKWYEGLGLYHQEKFAEAEEAFDIAIAQTPYHFRLCNDFASCKVKLGKYAEAIPAYERAIFINPEYEDARFSIAFVLAQMGRFEEAIFHVNQTKNDPTKKEIFLTEINKMIALKNDDSNAK